MESVCVLLDLVSLSIMLSRFINGVAGVRIFLFKGRIIFQCVEGPHCIYPSSVCLPLHLSMDIWGLLDFGYYEQRWYEHSFVMSTLGFLQV